MHFEVWDCSLKDSNFQTALFSPGCILGALISFPFFISPLDQWNDNHNIQLFNAEFPLPLIAQHESHLFPRMSDMKVWRNYWVCTGRSNYKELPLMYNFMTSDVYPTHSYFIKLFLLYSTILSTPTKMTQWEVLYQNYHLKQHLRLNSFS